MTTTPAAANSGAVNGNGAGDFFGATCGGDLFSAGDRSLIPMQVSVAEQPVEELMQQAETIDLDLREEAAFVEQSNLEDTAFERSNVQEAAFDGTFDQRNAQETAFESALEQNSVQFIEPIQDNGQMQTFGDQAVFLQQDSHETGQYLSQQMQESLQLGNDYVQGDQMVNDCRQADPIPNNFLQNDQIANDYVENYQLGNDYVENDQLANDYVENYQLGNDYVENYQLGNDCRQSDPIPNDYVQAVQIPHHYAQNDPILNDYVQNDQLANDFRQSDQIPHHYLQDDQFPNDGYQPGFELQSALADRQDHPFGQNVEFSFHSEFQPNPQEFANQNYQDNFYPDNSSSQHQTNPIQAPQIYEFSHTHSFAEPLQQYAEPVHTHFEPQPQSFDHQTIPQSTTFAFQPILEPYPSTEESSQIFYQQPLNYSSSLIPSNIAFSPPAQSNQCPKCFRANDPDSNFCSKCGSPLVQSERLELFTEPCSSPSFESAVSKSSTSLLAQDFAYPQPEQQSFVQFTNSGTFIPRPAAHSFAFGGKMFTLSKGSSVISILFVKPSFSASDPCIQFLTSGKGNKKILAKFIEEKESFEFDASYLFNTLALPREQLAQSFVPADHSKIIIGQSLSIPTSLDLTPLLQGNLQLFTEQSGDPLNSFITAYLIGGQADLFNVVSAHLMTLQQQGSDNLLCIIYAFITAIGTLSPCSVKWWREIVCFFLRFPSVQPSQPMLQEYISLLWAHNQTAASCFVVLFATSKVGNLLTVKSSPVAPAFLFAENWALSEIAGTLSEKQKLWLCKALADSRIAVGKLTPTNGLDPRFCNTQGSSPQGWSKLNNLIERVVGQEEQAPETVISPPIPTPEAPISPPSQPLPQEPLKSEQAIEPKEAPGPSKSAFGFIKGLFKLSSKASASDDRSSIPEAKLGEENTLVYDAASRQWIDPRKANAPDSNQSKSSPMLAPPPMPPAIALSKPAVRTGVKGRYVAVL